MASNNKNAPAYKNVSAANFAFWGSPVITKADGTLYCPGFVGDTYMKNVYDVLFINNAVSSGMAPGIAEVRVNKFRDLDKKKAAGSDGARLTVHGIEPAMVEIRLTIWTPEQLKALNELWPVLFPRGNKRPFVVKNDTPWPPAFDCQHPELKQHSVKSLVFIGGEGPAEGSARAPRARVFTMRAIEFFPPGKKSVTSTPTAPLGSINDPKATPKPSQNPKNTGPT